MTRHRPQLHPWARRAPWLLCALALAATLALQVLAIPAWQAQAAAARQQLLQRLQQRARAAAVAATPASASGGDWRAGLPDAQARDARLADLLQAAVQHGVRLQTVDQGTVLRGPAGVLQQPVALTARGRYAELRGFIEQALLADPALLLEQVALVRAAPDADDVQARLRLSLVQRDAPRAGP